MARRRRVSRPSFKIADAGKMGREIYNEIVNNISKLVPISGRITVEIDLLIKDDNVFKDDERRTSKLVIEIELGKPSKEEVKESE